MYRMSSLKRNPLIESINSLTERTLKIHIIVAFFFHGASNRRADTLATDDAERSAMVLPA